MAAPLGIVELKGKRVTVMGLGRFGGGVGAIRFLIDRGARVTVTDLLSESELEDSLAALDNAPLAAVHLGCHLEEDFCDTDLVVVSAAVRPGNEFVELARSRGISVTSEMCLFWQHQRGRIVGVTGSNGKSTTATLIHAILDAAGIGCRLGGNIGGSLLPEVDEIGDGDWSVLELSSFQLAGLDRLPASPDVAVVTNFSPNHLDWHGSLEEYRKAKQSILRWQSPEGTAVLNCNDADVAGWPAFGKCLWFGTGETECCGCVKSGDDVVMSNGKHVEPIPLSGWLRLPGEHNLQNAMAAVCAATAVGVPVSAIQQGIKAVSGLPHRLQFVAEVDGRRFYNDSLATTPESVAVALDAFNAPVVLLAGGYDKQVDLSGLAECIAKKVKAAALMGQTAEILLDLIEERDSRLQIPLCECESLDKAFRWAVGQSQPGDVVLLSPGCASYDWFRNFAERGQQFTDLVLTLRERSPE